MKIMHNMLNSLISRKHQSGAVENRQAGFSMIEMIIGVTVFTIVMGAIYGLLQVGRSGRLNTTMRSEALQNARVGINTVGRDIINSGVGYPNIGALIPDNRVSGLFGGTPDSGAEPDFLTPIYGRNNVNSINGTMTDLMSIAFIDNSFNAGVSIPISIISATGSQVTIPAGFSNAPCTVGEIYLISGQTSAAALGMLTSKTSTDRLNFATGDPLGINLTGASSPIILVNGVGGSLNPASASLQRVSLVRYYVVDDDGPTNPGSGTLMRDVYGGATPGFTTQPLAFGIENFQCQYVMDDGAILDAPTQAQMLGIRQVRIALTVRSPEIDPQTNRPFRQTISATYNARNLEYEKF
jgi:prepilin-type N-terminal cleavage/methylation domain-containing protein